MRTGFISRSLLLTAEINPTPNPGDGDDFLMDSSPGNLTVFNGQLYFSADDGYNPGLRSLQPRVFALTVPEPAMAALLPAMLFLLRRSRKHA